MSESDKVIVTQRGPLRRKHGVRGLARIEAAIRRLVLADKKRKLQTRLVYLDVAADMQGIGRRVARATDQRAAKRAIDDVFRALQPDYLLILGAPDVVPHQQLVNPMAASRDDDRLVPSDLPYACDAGYSRSIRDFLGPTRVIGRLPDVQGTGNTAYLVSLLDTASSWRSRKLADYRRVFALSAESWQRSTRTSVGKLFGRGRRVHVSPKEGPEFSDAALGARVHLINCHGDKVSPQFWGESAANESCQPVALTAAELRGSVTKASVVAAECCYGAQLYEPQAGRPIGICNVYLAEGALGFLGSSSISYGPDQGNNFCDYLCVKFLEAVRLGASLGRASLMAQQHYVAIGGYMEMADLKTLAQFMLLGDPAIQPVRGPPGALASAVAARRFRRKRLTRRGQKLAATTAAVGSRPDAKARKRLLQHEALRGRRLRDVKSYQLHAPRGGPPVRTGKRLLAAGTVFHAVVLSDLGLPGRTGGPHRLLVVREVAGKVEKVVWVRRR